LEETMLDQTSNSSLQPPSATTPPVKLWTPGFIAGVSFLLGFPAGIVIASINWMRMQMNNKAIVHLLGGAVGAFVFLVLLFLLPGAGGRFLALIVNLGILFYLQRQMKRDIEGFKAANPAIADAGQLGGCLIGLGVLVVFFILAFVLAFAMSMVGIPIPE
jgi:hypothetical protein